MIPRAVEEITAADLVRLKEENVPEGRTLEYKLELPRKERLLATVCAFANQGTGDIVIGAEEKDHFLQALPGVPKQHVEEIKTRVEQWVRGGLEPQGVAVKCQEVRLGNDQFAIIVRVEQSWAGPHRISESTRFYGRHSTGNYDLSIEELKKAFVESTVLADRIRQFRRQRIESIASQETPIPLEDGPKVILHLVPLISVHDRFQINIHEAHKRLFDVTALKFEIQSRRFNLDGVVGSETGGKNSQPAYLQVFRNGIIEAVRILNTSSSELIPASAPGKVAPPERSIMPALPAYLSFLQQLGVPSPIFAMISVIDVKGYWLWLPPNVYPSTKGTPSPKTSILLPEIELPPSSEDAVKVLRPLFDMFWKGFGYSRSMNFDNNDNFRAH